MGYTQGNNPLSRKNSPLNANNPFKRVSPLNMAQGEGEEKMSHKEMRKAGKLKDHKAKKHGGDPEREEEIMEENLSQEANIPMGPERRSSSPLNDGEELNTYKNLSAEEIPGYDDGAGGLDYEAKAKANKAPGAQYTDEEAEAEFDRMKYITDAAIKKGAGAVVTANPIKHITEFLDKDHPHNQNHDERPMHSHKGK